MVKWGCCISPWSVGGDPDATVARTAAMLAQLADAGFAYAELPATSLAQMPAEAMPELVRAVEQSGTPVLACNSFVPATIPLVGPQRDLEQIRDYVTLALGRCAQMGVRTVVFGSGTARRVPDGLDRAVALRQIGEFLGVCNDVGARIGVDTVIEPLRKAESNVINRVAEAADLARGLNLPHIRVLADSYHMAAEREAYAVLDGVADLLGHVHVANARERRYPGHDPRDVDDLADMFGHLQRGGYGGGVSIECRFDSFVEELPRALDTLRDAWKGAAGRA